MVGADFRIISYNRRFAEMWRLPPEKFSASNQDAEVLAAVTSSMVHPEAFLERVRYLYAHPDAEGHDEIETGDGRVIDRHTATLRTSGGEYLGRIWFFRDITEDIRRAKERELQNYRFQAALNNMTQGLCMFDGERRLVVSNRQYAEMYRISPQDVCPGTLLEDHLRQRLEAGNQPIGGGDATVADRLAMTAGAETAALEIEFSDGRTISVRHKPLPTAAGWKRMKTSQGSAACRRAFNISPSTMR